METVNTGSADLLSPYRHSPVSMGCTQDIPETIQEESEGRRESLAATSNNMASGSKIETLADIVQSSEESGNSNSLLTPFTEDNQAGSQNSSFCFSESELNLLGTDCRPVWNNTAPFKMKQEVTDCDFNRSADNRQTHSALGQNSVQNNVSGNCKVTPAQPQSFEKAVGFLLESKTRKNRKRANPRVTFNYV